MPYRDPEQRRQYQRAYQRARRAQANGRRTLPASSTPASEALAALRIRTAHDVLVLLEEQLNLVRADTRIGVLERARVVGNLATVLLRAVETADIEDRIAALEAAAAGEPKPDEGR